LALVPHVIRDPRDAESDWAAAKDLEALLIADYPDRVATLPQDYDATELKWIIAELDWFAGARMHATIAGLSSGVPTLGFGYSDKAEGVFTQCGLDGQVADLRTHNAQDIADAVRSSLAARAKTKPALAKSLDALKARASDQMDLIVETINQSRTGK
jgi:polysaccharide pyruvyl transferase WcaK-like protein